MSLENKTVKYTFYLLCCVSFRRLDTLLKISTLGINKLDRNGNTPLLACLKRKQPDKIIIRLLSAGASIMIANKKKITPLSFAMSDNRIIQLLLKHCKNTQFMYKNTVKKRFHKAVKICPIKRNSVNERIILYVIRSNPICKKRIVAIDLNTFLDQLKAINADVFNCVCDELSVNSFFFYSATVFKAIWDKADHMYIAGRDWQWLLVFFQYNSFTNKEFIDCLHMVLSSEHAKDFIHTIYDFHATLYSEILDECILRDIKKRDRMHIISSYLHLADVTIADIDCAYQNYGFEEEVVFLIQHFKFTKSDYHEIYMFLLELEEDPEFHQENLNKLGLDCNLSYRKLLHILPDEVIEDKRIRLKKETLNQIPTLYELASHTLQKHLLKVYNIQNKKQYVATVNALPIPEIIKNDLCDKPPKLYYRSYCGV